VHGRVQPGLGLGVERRRRLVQNDHLSPSLSVPDWISRKVS
jgi:hypothetical protein